MSIIEVDLPIPDHTTLSRRIQKLGEIVASDLTARRTHDCTPVPGLLDRSGTATFA